MTQSEPRDHADVGQQRGVPLPHDERVGQRGRLGVDRGVRGGVDDDAELPAVGLAEHVRDDGRWHVELDEDHVVGRGVVEGGAAVEGGVGTGDEDHGVAVPLLARDDRLSRRLGGDHLQPRGDPGPDEPFPAPATRLVVTDRGHHGDRPRPLSGRRPPGARHARRGSVGFAVRWRSHPQRDPEDVHHDPLLHRTHDDDASHQRPPRSRAPPKRAP